MTINDTDGTGRKDAPSLDGYGEVEHERALMRMLEAMRELDSKVRPDPFDVDAQFDEGRPV